MEQIFNFHIWLQRDYYIKCTLLCIFASSNWRPYSQFGIPILHFFHPKKCAGCLPFMVHVWCHKTNHFTYHHLYSKVSSGKNFWCSHLDNTNFLYKVHLLPYYFHHPFGAQRHIGFHHTTFFPSQKMCLNAFCVSPHNTFHHKKLCRVSVFLWCICGVTRQTTSHNITYT